MYTPHFGGMNHWSSWYRDLGIILDCTFSFTYVLYICAIYLLTIFYMPMKKTGFWERKNFLSFLVCLLAPWGDIKQWLKTFTVKKAGVNLSTTQVTCARLFEYWYDELFSSRKCRCELMSYYARRCTLHLCLLRWQRCMFALGSVCWLTNPLENFGCLLLQFECLIFWASRFYFWLGKYSVHLICWWIVG